ncbi:MAG: DUF4397 domain-containing protein [Bacteroidota bacterium]|jgi:hypothetical protein
MKNLLLTVVSAFMLATSVFAQKVVETDPARPIETGGVTITYRPALDEKDGKTPMVDVSEIWAYTGCREAQIAQDPSTKYYEKYGWNDLKNFPEMKLTNNGDGTYTLKIDNIKAFYNVPDDKPVREMLFVFRNVDGTIQGADRLIAVDPAGGSATSSLRLINGVSTSTKVDVIVAQADEPQITEIGFQLASVYKEVPGGAAVQMKAKASGAPAPIYADVSCGFPLEKGGKYTFLIGADASGEYTSKVLTDDVETKAGITKLRFVHWSPSTPAVDIRAVLPTGDLSPPVVANAKFGDIANVEVPAGSYKLAVTAAGDGSKALITFNPVQLPGATNLTVVAFGNENELTKVRAFIDNGNGRDFVDLLPLGQGWVIKANPEVPSKNEGVEIQYNPENDVKDGQFKMVGVDPAYVYTGARDYAGGFFQKSEWGAVGTTDALKLTKNADGTFSWSIPSPIWQFYPGVEETKVLKELLFVFRNADGSKQGSDVPLRVGDGSGPTVTTDPKDVTDSKPLALTYYPWNDKKDGSFKMVGEPVYVYTGGTTEDGSYLEKAGWGNVGTTDGLKLTMNNDGTATWNIADLNAFYSVPTGKKLKEILCVFRNADGTRQGADVKIPVNQPTSVEDEKLAAEINVFPNPTPGMARITLPSNAPVRVSVINQLGTVLYTTTATGELMWNGRDFSGNVVAPGAYMVQVQTATASAVVPMMIVR